MSSSLLAIALSAALSQVPYGPPGQVASGPSAPGPENASSGTGLGAFGAGEPYFPFDAYEPWVHGHFQRIPAYGGYHYYRPYNYRHVMPQSQVSAGWGMPATMPYSQGFFRSREGAQHYGASSAPYYYYPTQSERQYYSRYQGAQNPVTPVGSRSAEFPVEYSEYPR